MSCVSVTTAAQVGNSKAETVARLLGYTMVAIHYTNNQKIATLAA